MVTKLVSTEACTGHSNENINSDNEDTESRHLLTNTTTAAALALDEMEALTLAAGKRAN